MMHAMLDSFVPIVILYMLLQVVDTSSGESVVHVPDAHEGAVWSLCVRPDGNGVMTGSADKEVKFWDFSVRSFCSVAHFLGDDHLCDWLLCVGESSI